MAWDKGFDFRSTNTSAYANIDPTNCTYVLGETALQTRNSCSFKWVSAPSVSNRLSTIDARLAGINYVLTSTTAALSREFQVTLPASGDYDLRLAMGDVTAARGGGTGTEIHIEVKDGATSLFTIGGPATSLAVAEFIDANNVHRSSVADWVANNTARRVTMAGTTLSVIVYGSGASSLICPIAHLFVSQVATGTPATATPSGVGSASALGTVTGNGAALSFPTGLSSTSTLGTSSASGAGNSTITGLSTTSFLGTPSAMGAGKSAPIGQASASALGTVVSSGLALSITSGLQAQSSVGLAQGSGTAVCAPSGLGLAVLLGLAVGIGGDSIPAIAYALGLQAAISIGQASGSGLAQASIDGLDSVIEVGIPVGSGCATAFPFGLDLLMSLGLVVGPVSLFVIASLFSAPVFSLASESNEVLGLIFRTAPVIDVSLESEES